jgi:VWFA-related protein
VTRPTRRRSGCAALLAAALATAVGAQRDQPTPPAFRTQAELVIVDAVVVDRTGKPLSDLTAADFELFDEGQPQTIAFFQAVSAAPAAERATRPARRRVTYSTNVGVDARVTRSFVLFFDDLHLTREVGDRAKRAVARFIERELADGDLVSLVVPGRALRWHARMPHGRDELVRMVEGLQGAFLPEPSSEQMSDYEAYRIHVFQDAAVADQVDRRWKSFRVLGREPTDLSRDPGFRPENRGGNIGIIRQDIAIRAAAVYEQASARNRTTLSAIAQTLEGLATVRGRKSLMLVSPGFIEDQERRLSRPAIDAARRANVALYFVDARGLVAGPPFSQAQFGSALDSRDIGAATANIALEAEGAANLASESGGFSIRNQNDLDAALGRIGRESQLYYLLGYQPRESGKPGTYRRIQVKVRRPGVDVRARRGYEVGGSVVAPNANAATLSADVLARATESPYDLGDVPLRTTAFVFGEPAPGTALVVLAIEADLRAFALARKDGQLTDVLDLRMSLTHHETGRAERYERQVEMSFPADVRFNAEWWHNLSQEFRLAPGRYQARVAVRDRNSGRLGAVTHESDVPALRGLRVTTPILTNTIENPSLLSPGPPKPVLVVRRTFPAGSTLYYQFTVMGATHGADALPRVVASHEVRSADGTVIRRMEPRPIAPAATGGLSRFAGIALAGVPDGDYELVLRVVDQETGASKELREPFSIAPPARELGAH